AAKDFTATISWGDGQKSAGTVTPDPSVPGLFEASGGNTYATEGTYPVTVAIFDKGGASATANSTAVVADAPLSARGASISATEGVTFTAIVARFTDADPRGVAGDFTAAVDWGDGKTSAGTIAPDPLVAGSFTVTGSHAYAEE